MVACQREACSATCADGYAADGDGCLSCACATPALDCTVDTDCVRAPNDCCGCLQGGFDTAVSLAGLPAHEAELMCGLDPICPGPPTLEQVTCTPDLQPTCVQGRCELVPPEPPPGACGRPELPACPAGFVCLVNDSDQATAHGVGLCAPATPPTGP